MRACNQPPAERRRPQTISPQLTAEVASHHSLRNPPRTIAAARSADPLLDVLYR